MSFGSNLIALRERNGISRKDLANMLRIPYTTLRNYETDQREPGHQLLIQLATIFSVSVDELIDNPIRDTPNNFTLSKNEIAHMEKYRALDEYGKGTVDTILDREYDRCQKQTQTEQKPKLHLYQMIARDGTREERWITDEELKALQETIRTAEKATGL